MWDERARGVRRARKWGVREGQKSEEFERVG